MKEVIETGQEGGAGNLIVCEILLMHISESILDADQRIDQNLIDLVGRMGGPWYSRNSGDSLFELKKPKGALGIGVEQIPEAIRLSKILTGNNLGQLGSAESLPSKEEVAAMGEDPGVKKISEQHNDKNQEYREALHTYAKALLDSGKIDEAWKVLLLD